MKNTLLKSLLLGFSLALSTPMVLAHGSLEPEHGGIVKEKHDLIVELVREAAGTSIYVKEHDDPVNTAELIGSLTILAAGKKQEVQLTAAGDNKMSADVVLTNDTKVLVKIKPQGHHAVVLRYSF